MRPNPYPWLPEWYWERYAETIDRFWRYVAEILTTARNRGFDVSMVSQTQPQIGSAGTVTLRASCQILNFSDTRLFDDRVILSFEGDHLRFLRYWLRTDACARIQEPAARNEQQQSLGTFRTRAGWRPNREAARVLSEGLGKLR